MGRENDPSKVALWQTAFPIGKAQFTGMTETNMQADSELVTPPDRVRLLAKARRRSVVPLLPARLRRADRPPLVYELVLIGLSYWIYSLIRNAVPEHRGAAMHHAEWLYSAERTLHIAVEPAINRAVDSVTWLIIGMNYYYATLHFVVTVGVLVWLYLRHPTRYRPARSALYLTNAFALVGYYTFPLAPPRFFPEYGFIDTVVKHDTWGSLASGDVAAASNQYAAMPSMHVGWSLWCGIIICMLARSRWVRVLAVLYPLATLTVIVSTGNHFVLDAVGGALALGLGFTVQYVLSGRSATGLTAELGYPAAVVGPGSASYTILTSRRSSLVGQASQIGASTASPTKPAAATAAAGEHRSAT